MAESFVRNWTDGMSREQLETIYYRTNDDMTAREAMSALDAIDEADRVSTPCDCHTPARPAIRASTIAGASGWGAKAWVHDIGSGWYRGAIVRTRA